MTTTFPSSSRIANLREKKNSHLEDPLNSNSTESELKANEQTSGYQPTFANTRPTMRLLKGKIDRSQSKQKHELKSNPNPMNSESKLPVEEKTEGLRLTLNEFEHNAETKSAHEPPKPPPKRILIQKKTSVDEQNKPGVEEPNTLGVESHKKSGVEQAQQRAIQNSKSQTAETKPELHEMKPPIEEQDVEESRDQPENENDLIVCPEGCGRKFNRRALEKHVKACKVVFMSKRKEFNSEAKRITSKEQAGIIKQNKQKEKAQLGRTKSRNPEKTAENWKAASKDFREAIKAVKKEEEDHEEPVLDANLQLVDCQYCEKKFARVLLDKHFENCQKKKEKEQRRRTTKKK